MGDITECEYDDTCDCFPDGCECGEEFCTCECICNDDDED